MYNYSLHVFNVFISTFVVGHIKSFLCKKINIKAFLLLHAHGNYDDVRECVVNNRCSATACRVTVALLTALTANDIDSLGSHIFSSRQH